jgi:biotin carboxylase
MTSRGPKGKILILGATENQIPVIQEVETRGFVSVVVDNNPLNPGHQIASDSYSLSTTDTESLVLLGRSLGIVGVVSHGSDPAALSAAVVASQLSLPGDSVEAVTLVQNKVTLRVLQRSLGLPVPEFIEASNPPDLANLLLRSPGGIIVKPVDGSGSRGVIRVLPGSSAQLLDFAFRHSFSQSRSGRVVAEQLLPHPGIQMGGDVVFSGGRVQQVFFTTQFMADRGVGLAVTANLIPTTFDLNFRMNAVSQLQRLIEKSGLRQGIYNFEFVAGEGDLPLLIDFGARSGGGLYSELFAGAYGVDTVSLNVDLALGRTLSFTPRAEPSAPVLGLTLHSLVAGRFTRVSFSEKLERLMVKRYIRLSPGDSVSSFSHSGDRVGMVIATAPDGEALAAIAENVYENFHVEVEEI